MVELSDLQQEDQTNKLALQVKYLNDLLDNMNELFYTYDINGIVTFTSKKSHDIAGIQFDPALVDVFLTLDLEANRTESDNAL